MKRYDYLFLEREHGHLDLSIKAGLIGAHLYTWMDVYSYHLCHPELSQFEVCKAMNLSKKMVYKIYQFMSATI